MLYVRRQPLLASTLLFGAVAALGLSGCLFDTRSPEAGGGEVCYESVPSTQETIVFNNLDGSMECLQAASYLDQLLGNFEFIPSAGVASQFPTLFTGPGSWGLAQEEQFLDRLFADADSIQSHILLEETGERSGTDPITFEGRYLVRVVDRSGGAIVYSGEAFYTLEQSATTWFMTRWEEKESAVGETPLGQLRGGLLQGG